MDLDAKRRLEAGIPLVVGERKMYVVSEVVSFHGEEGVVFAILISPMALVVFEGGRQFALSLVEGTEVTLKSLIDKEPSLREKLPFDQPLYRSPQVPSVGTLSGF